MSVSTNQLHEINCSCVRHIINILLTELSRSVWENLDLGRVYRPHCIRSVLTTSVKILPYRPPALLIRAKYWPEVVAVRTGRSEVRAKTTEGQYSPVRLEQARLVSSLLYGTLFVIVKCTSCDLYLKMFIFSIYL